MLTADSLPSEAVETQPSNDQTAKARWDSVRFHLLLNLGRLLSYMLVGSLLGTLGAMLVWSGQLTGVGSDLRRAIALVTGLLLMWFGIRQTWPALLPKIPLRFLAQTKMHHWVEHCIQKIAASPHGVRPLALGLVWGLMPCGFLFAAQLKAAGASEPWMGALVMLGFGLGTMPMMVGIGVTSSLLSQQRRSQLFRAGGIVAIAIGALTVLRTGDLMVDYTAYAALGCLMLALAARPIRQLWSAPFRYRRGLGVGGFILAMAHIVHRIEHTWNWKIDAISFMPMAHQQGIVSGLMGILLLIPLTGTSFDQAQRCLGVRWRKLHLLSVPALVLSAVHTVMVGSSFLGSFQLTWLNYALTATLIGLVIGVLLVRSPWFWSMLSIKQLYTFPYHASTVSHLSSSSLSSDDAHCDDAHCDDAHCSDAGSISNTHPSSASPSNRSR